MKNTQPLFVKTLAEGADLRASQIPRCRDMWLMTGEINHHSERTCQARRDVLDKLIWLLDRDGYETCTTASLRAFLHHATAGHKEPGGRWGNPRMVKATSPGTIKTYHSILRAFFSWLVNEGEIESSPMAKVAPPVNRPDQIQPFTDEQLTALLKAAGKSKHPKRDEAILMLMLDTGARASEVCSMKVGDIDLPNNQCHIEHGKGGKSRSVPISRETKRALYIYINERGNEPNAPLFLSMRGPATGEPLTRHGLRFLILRLGEVATLDGVRVSPHTLRHSFSIGFLRAGGNMFTLQQMLGHTHLAMTNRYVAIAQADIENQHRQFSPVMRLKGGRGK